MEKQDTRNPSRRTFLTAAGATIAATVLAEGSVAAAHDSGSREGDVPMREICQNGP